VTTPARFDTAEPDEDARPFVITGWRGRPGHREKLEETFLARPDVSFGALLDELTAAETGDSSIFEAFRMGLVEENSSEDEEDERSEFDRFRDFVAAPDVYVSKDALLGALRWMTGEHGERPTGQSSGSRSTRRAGARGSAGRRRR
jgi:hypothetical protein